MKHKNLSAIAQVESERKEVPFDKLVPAYWNPAHRVSPATLKTLIVSMKQVKLLSPLKVYEDKGKFNIIDGHRRHAALREMGYRGPVTVDVYELSNSLAIYRESNKEIRAHQGKEKLYLYLNQPRALPERTIVEIQGYENRYGRDVLERLISADRSYDLLRQIRQLTGVWEKADDPELARMIANWTLDHKMFNFIKKQELRSKDDPRLVIEWGVMEKFLLENQAYPL
jgi:hypothetical protein